MKTHKLFFPLLLTIVVILGACGQAPTTQQASAPTAAPSAAGAAEATPAPSGDSSQATPATSSAGTTTEPSPVPTATTNVSTVGSGTTKITWWHNSTADAERANWENLAKTFVAQNPNVSIEITVIENEAFKAKLATAMQSGNPPDIFQSWGGGVLKQYADAGLAQDLTPALKENGWGDSFQKGPLSLYTFDGKTYGVPWRAGMIGFWYDKALFEKAGIAQPPATWNELLDAVKKLKAANITPIGLGEKDKWPGHYYWVYLATRIGGQAAFDKAYTRQGSFTDPAFVEAGVRLKELVDLQPFQNGFLGAGYADQTAVMGNNQAAMELMGHWAPGADRGVAADVDSYNKNLGWFPFPTVDGGAGDPSDAVGGGDGFAVGKNAPPEAIKFVRFMTSLENQIAMVKSGIAVPPVVKGAEAAMDDPLLKEVQTRAAQAKYYQLYYDQYLPPAVGQAVNDATQGLFASTSSPEEVANTIEEVAATELTP